MRNFENRTFAQNNSKIYNEKADERSFNNGEAELQGTRRVLSSQDLEEKPQQEVYGKFAFLRRQYLMKQRYGVYLNYLTTGTLNNHLIEIQKQAEEMMEITVRQMMELQGVTEELKAQNQLEWIRKINNINQSAEEMILKDLIYS